MILDQIVEDKKKRLLEHKAKVSEEKMRRLAEQTPTRDADCFYRNLKKPGLSIIGEFKKASPSMGQITQKIDLMERIDILQQSLAHYEQIKRFTLLPHHFSMEKGEITNTLKLRRGMVNKHYKDIIDGMYANTPSDGVITK